MTNDDSAQVHHNLATMTQPSRHASGTTIRPDIRRKVLALVAKVDAKIAAEIRKLPKTDPYAEARRGRARAVSTSNLKRGRPSGTGHGRIGPRLPGSTHIRVCDI